MLNQEIKRLAVSRGSDYLIYERSAGNGPVYLEQTGDGVYVVRLKSGQYGFGADETGRGEVAIDFIGGGFIDGRVVSTDPPTLPEGSTLPINITLNIEG